nr:MAG TPA: Protein of unknown function (DUF3290) [Caudoviricetes sp.]
MAFLFYSRKMVYKNRQISVILLLTLIFFFCYEIIFKR